MYLRLLLTTGIDYTQMTHWDSGISVVVFSLVMFYLPTFLHFVGIHRYNV